MAGRNPQTQAKRARELATKEKQERKRAKKADLAAQRAQGIDPYADLPEAQPEPAQAPDSTS